MNALIESGAISEMSCGSNFAYILHDEGQFLPTDYKMLQNKANSCYVKCMKMRYNGELQIFYLTKSLVPLASMLPTLDAERFLKIVTNIMASVLDVKNNGFLSCENVDISYDHIFVDPASFQVRLVYLPMSRGFFHDYAMFENELRTGLIKLISEMSNLFSPKTGQLVSNLSNGTLSIEDLYSWMKKGKTDWCDPKPAKSDATMKLVSMKTSEPFQLEVKKDSFVIGKNPAAVDGVISFNKMISRVHCRIDKHGERYMISDLQSANGTYVNRVKLVPNHPHAIKHGDVVRLANSDFQIVIS